MRIASGPVLLVLLVLLACAAVPAGADPTTAAGAELYQRFCASCHGAEGHGDGPAATTLDPPPADLTTIARRRAGRFPDEEIHAIVDGRAVLPAHGTRAMPVWGYELEARAPPPAPGRASAQAMTQRLVDYLRGLQRE